MENKNRLTYRVSAALAGEILSQKMPIGAKLPPDTDLCEKFQVSRTVLRETLRVLGAKGLITAKPRVGTLVAEAKHWALWDPEVLHWLTGAALSQEALADIAHHALDMRLALEPSLAALASSRASDAAKQQLQHALRDLQDTPDLAHEQGFIHCAICKAPLTWLMSKVSSAVCMIFLAINSPPSPAIWLVGPSPSAQLRCR